MERDDSDALGRLEQKLGWRFRDPLLLQRALTHSSYANEHPPTLDHERLALIGDAVLALVVAERLCDEDPVASVGLLTPRRAEIVSGANLARWAAELGIGEFLRLGRGEDLTGGRARASILATALEAVLGAIYLEGGIEAVRAGVARLSP